MTNLMRALALIITLAPVTGSAMSINGTYYAVGDQLREVGFDGTSFIGSATILEPLSPDWTAMSYDVDAGQMYYAVGDQLRSVGFDGTSFIGAATILEPLSPDWTAMSLTFSGTPDTSAIPEPSTVVLMGLGLVGLGVATRRKLLT
jgi:hypothetical protein